jgi:hypothetical protein
MFKPSDFAVPVPSFRKPVPVPGVSATDNPDMSVCINSKWTPYILGAFKQLLLQTTWDTNDENVLEEVQGQVFDLMALFANQFDCVNEKSIVYEEIGDMTSFRQDCDCNLFVQCCDGTEKKLAFSGDVPASNQTNGGEPQPAPGGGLQDYCKSFNANAVSLIPALLNSGDVITMESVSGSGYDGTGLAWYCSNGNVLFVDCQPASGHLDGTDPLPTSNHMSLIVRIGASFYHIDVGSPLTVPGGVVNAQGWFQINDADLSNNYGNYQLCYQVQNNVVASWCYEFDFALTNGGWTASLDGFYEGLWSAGSGWTPNTGTDAGGDLRRIMDILSPTFASTTITEIDMLFDYVGGYFNADSLAYRISYNGGVLMNVQHSAATDGTNKLFSWTGSLAMTRLELYIQTDFGFVSPHSPTGSALLKRVTIKGVGTNPFGSSNC